MQKIKAALIPHTKAEEKVVYNAVIALRDKEAQVDGHEGYLEHEWAAKTLQRLDSIVNATSPEHKAAAKVLKELVEHHIREEESNVWDDVTENFSDDDRKRMNVASSSPKLGSRSADPNFRPTGTATRSMDRATALLISPVVGASKSRPGRTRCRVMGDP